ncbi:MAG: hypothetical protein OER95_18720, partial [Acidimicrobiia bacterium]|nr:hypothetical protein [Acidimicrobiia bacterium]
TVTTAATSTSTTTTTTSSSTTSSSSTTVVDGTLMPPEDVQAVAVNGDVTLSWSAPSTGPTPSSYIIYRDGGLLAQADASPYVDSGLAPGSYRYRVAALGTNATESDLSLPATVEIPLPEPLDVTASLSGSTITSLTIRVVSNPCMASIRISYVIDGSGDDPEVLPVGHNPCVTEDTILLSRLRPNTTYRVNVTASGVDGGVGAALPMRLSTG